MKTPWANINKAMSYAERNPKSVCTCGHSGDGGFSAHNGIMGHGACMHCPCRKFSWKSWTEGFARIMGFDKKAR